MSAPPSVAPFAGLLADLAADLRRGANCLLVCDKGWTLWLFRDLWQRLKAKGLRCEYLDGRPAPDAEGPADVGIMLTAITQIRKAVRGAPEGVIFALPHLDVMTTADGGWTNISREVVPLLYENAAAQWLGFCDPSLPLLPVVEKLFTRRYVLDAPFRPTEGAPVRVTTPPPPEPPATDEAPEVPVEVRAEATSDEAPVESREETADPPPDVPAEAPPEGEPPGPTSSPGGPG
jgi:hypothetical protein